MGNCGAWFTRRKARCDATIVVSRVSGALCSSVAPTADPPSIMLNAFTAGLCVTAAILVVATDGIAVYPHLSSPAAHPDRAWWPTPHPDYALFNSSGRRWPRFATLRGFEISPNGSATAYSQLLDEYTGGLDTAMGDVVWPMYPLLWTNNLADVINDVASRDLFVTDIWAYVPGSGPGTGGTAPQNPWQQFTPPAESLRTLAAGLGERWLGMDVGEQDGRYVGGYAAEAPQGGSQGREAQRRNFERHFEAMSQQLGNRCVMLASLTFPHYAVRHGTYTLAGAETAQALISSPVFYAFLRGAGKMYGVLWFGNVSVYNRFGYKSFPALLRGISTALSQAVIDHKPKSPSRTFKCTGGGGPTCGTSTNLMKRLMYSQMFYSSVYVSFESGWYYPNGTLSPIGYVQRAAREFAAERADDILGTHVAQLALLLPFNAGWDVPRQLYSAQLYRVWGTTPYETGDYLADNILRMVYPRYQDSSYFHDETGFQTATPYGDGLDVLLTDAAPWVLSQYDTIVVAGQWESQDGSVDGRAEATHNLASFVNSGGHLLLTAGPLLALQQSGSDATSLLGGIGVGAHSLTQCSIFPAGTNVTVSDGTTLTESRAFAACSLSLPRGATTLASVDASKQVLAARVSVGTAGGTVTVIASPYGVPAASVGPPSSSIDETLLTPFPMLAHVGRLLDAAMDATTLFSASRNRSLCTVVSQMNTSTFSLLVSNPTLAQQDFVIESRIGQIKLANEVPLDQTEKTLVGYLPDGYEGTDLGNSTATTIAGGDVRVFSVTVTPNNALRPLPVAQPKPAPQGVCLTVNAADSIVGSGALHEAVASRPTFSQHYDCIVADFRLAEAGASSLAQQCAFLDTRGVRVILDASPAINLFPDLRLINNSAAPYAVSMARLQATIAAASQNGAGCGRGRAGVMLSLHRVPENDFTRNQTLVGFATTIGSLAKQASAANITLHIRTSSKFSMDVNSTWEWMQQTGLAAAGVRLAPSIGLAMRDGTTPAVLAAVAETAADVLLLSARADDVSGAPFTDRHAVATAAATYAAEALAMLKASCSTRSCPYNGTGATGARTRLAVATDAEFPTRDAEWREAAWLETALGA